MAEQASEGMGLDEVRDYLDAMAKHCDSAGCDSSQYGSDPDICVNRAERILAAVAALVEENRRLASELDVARITRDVMSNAAQMQGRRADEAEFALRPEREARERAEREMDEARKALGEHVDAMMRRAPVPRASAGLTRESWLSPVHVRRLLAMAQTSKVNIVVSTVWPNELIELCESWLAQHAAEPAPSLSDELMGLYKTDWPQDWQRPRYGDGTLVPEHAAEPAGVSRPLWRLEKRETGNGENAVAMTVSSHQRGTLFVAELGEYERGEAGAIEALVEDANRANGTSGGAAAEGVDLEDDEEEPSGVLLTEEPVLVGPMCASGCYSREDCTMPQECFNEPAGVSATVERLAGMSCDRHVICPARFPHQQHLWCAPCLARMVTAREARIEAPEESE